MQVANYELGDYLRTLRAATSPSKVGLPTTKRRRVPGLRRDELANLVGLSTEYYVRLEQGRAENPSAAALSAIAQALQLDQAQTNHLSDLAANAVRLQPTKNTTIRDELASVVGEIADLPAIITNRSLDVLAFNELACRVITDFAALSPHDRNMARHIFLDPTARATHPDWDRAARDTVGMLRLAVLRPPLEEGLVSLISELRGRSEIFEQFWETHYVYEKTHGEKSFYHPMVGMIDLQYETFLIAGEHHHMLVVYTASPNSTAAARLRQLQTGEALGGPLRAVGPPSTPWA